MRSVGWLDMSTRPEFISRFLYRVGDDELYWMPGTPPSAEVIEEAAAAARDILGFDAHSAAFTMLAEVIDVCTAEELESKGVGLAARNAIKHPRVIALTKLESVQRASIAVAAAQGLAWMEDCRKWVQDATLRNQIAKRVMTGIIVGIGRIKKDYSSAQLSALVRIGVSLRDNDVFVLRSRGAIAEILAGSLSNLPHDEVTLKALRRFLDVIAESPNAAPVFKAMDKLASLTSEDHAVQLQKAAAQWR